MNEFERQLQKLRTTRLPDEVRSRMRAELLSYAELHAYTPAPAGAAFKNFSFRMYAGLAALALIVLSIGGTAYASESALPGDTLYSIKVGIAEPLQTALIPSEQGKAAWHAILAERRLEEAAQLAASNKLTPAVQQQLAANMDTHVAASSRGADQLQTNGHSSAALSVRSDLEARLYAHEQILDVVAAHFAEASSTEDTATKLALNDLLTRVTTHERAVSASRVALENAISPGALASSTAASATGSTTPVLALGKASGRPHVRMHTTSAAQVADENSDRAQEVQSILVRHAALLAKFLPVATTTATSTATSTIQLPTGIATSTVQLHATSTENK